MLKDRAVKMIGLKTERRREIADEFGSFFSLHQCYQFTPLSSQTVVSSFLLPLTLRLYIAYITGKKKTLKLVDIYLILNFKML